MDLHFHMPTEIFFGRDCVSAYGERLKALGHSALIVTGKSSKINGALGDLCIALDKNGQTYTVFDRVKPNPTIACVREGIALLKSANADFIVGLGGGSPMDAAKAIALLAVADRADEDVFSGGYGIYALPMAHIPTTAGTGSEVTPYAILTNDVQETKTSITSPALFPKFAFLDGKYLKNAPRSTLIYPALDAFSHAVEGILSRKGNEISNNFACESLKVLYPILKKMSVTAPIENDLDALLYASMLAGITIAQSGTTAVHGMGYYLTYFYGIDHGRANALLLGETLKLCKKKDVSLLGKIEDACKESADEICVVLDRLLGKREDIPKDRLLDFAKHSVFNKNIKKSAYEPTPEEIKHIYLRSFCKND